MERSLRFPLLFAPVAALALALGAFYWGPGSFGASTSAPRILQAGKAASLAKAEQVVELVVRDVIPIEEADTHAVLLVSKDEAIMLPIFVTEEAAVSIAFRLADQQSPHPLAADLLDDVVLQMGGKVVQVRIDDVQDDVYTSRVTIRQGEKDLELAARPSDAIAMALTGKAQIFCTQKVLHEAGISREEIDALRDQMGIGGSGPEPEPDGSNIRL